MGVESATSSAWTGRTTMLSAAAPAEVGPTFAGHVTAPVALFNHTEATWACSFAKQDISRHAVCPVMRSIAHMSGCSPSPTP